jgi:hypothetical protein
VENGFLQKWPRVPKGSKIELRKKILMFSVFLTISVLIWLINALSKNYTADLDYPLEYTDFPEDRIFVGEMPDELTLRINAVGFSLLKYKVFRKPVPVSFRVSAFTLNRLDSSRAYILTRYLNDQVASQLPQELQLLAIEPDTLHFQWGRRVVKKVPVRPGFQVELDKQFTTVDGIRFQPDSVEVAGPDVILDTLRQVYTAHMDLGLLSRNYEGRLRLSRNPDLEYSTGKVDCFIELERFTEVSLQVPVEVENLPDSLVVQTFPPRVKLTCRVGLSKYDRVNNNQFRAVVNYQQASEEAKELDVEIQNLPAYLLGYEFSPRTVEFLTSRK